MARIALVTGIAGQDGYYLSNLLRSKGYEVRGVELPSRTVPPGLCQKVYAADIGTESGLLEILANAKPDEVYNLAGMSRVSDSFEHPVDFAVTNGVGAVRLLEAIRRQDYDVWSRRPVVTRRTKLRLAARCWWRLRRGTLLEDEA